MTLKQHATKCFVFDNSRLAIKNLAFFLCHLTSSASELRSVANYEVQKSGLSIRELEHRLENNFFARNLHSQSAQAILQKHQTAWKNTFANRTKRPWHQPKDGHFPVTWEQTVSNSSAENSVHPFSSRDRVRERTHRAANNSSLNSAKPGKLNSCQAFGQISHSLETVYSKPVQGVKDQVQLDSNKALAIDLSVSKFATFGDGGKSSTSTEGTWHRNWGLGTRKLMGQGPFLIKGPFLINRRFPGARTGSSVRIELHRRFRTRSLKEGRELLHRKDIGMIVVIGHDQGISSIDVGKENN